MCIIEYWCRRCARNTNHGIVSFEHDLPRFNYSFIQCLACDMGAFAVKYGKDLVSPESTSTRVSDVLPSTDEQETEETKPHSSQGWTSPIFNHPRI